MKRALLLVASFLPCLIYSSQVNPTKIAPRQLQNEEKVVHIAGIFDTQNFVWGEELFSFVVDLLNNKQDGWHDDLFTDGTTIDFKIADSGCASTLAARAFWQVRTEWDGLVHGIVGARCSSASLTLARIADLETIPQVSPSSTSEKLSNPDDFPFFSRTVSPDTDQGQVGALVALLRELGWRRVSIVITDVQYARDLSTEFQRLWEGDIAYHSTPIKIDPESGGVQEASALQALQGVPTDDPEINSRIMLLFAHDEHAFQILEMAHTAKFQTDSVWVGPQAWVGRKPDNTAWMPPFPGYIGVTPYRNHDDSKYLDFLSRIQDQQALEGREEWDALPDYAAEYMVDAIVVLVKALSSLPHEDRTDGALVTKRMRQLTWQGVSGQVQFTENGDRLDPKFTVFNIRNDGGAKGLVIWDDVGSVTVDSDAREGDTKLDWAKLCFAELPCGVIPTDRYKVPKDQIVLWVPIVLTIILFILLLVLVKYWRSKASKRRNRLEMQNMAKQLEKQMQGMVEVRHDLPIRSAQDYQEKAEMQNQRLRALWYWEEDPTNMHLHDSFRVLVGTHFVGYPHEISDQLEHHFQLWKEDRGFQQFDADLTDKITKVHQQHTGARYQIDFARMTQENATSGHKRGVLREEMQMQIDAAQTLPALPDDIDFGDEGEDLLPLLKGQVIQVSKKHPTQNDWAYGNVLYDPLLHDALEKSDGADETTSGLNTVLAKALHDRPTSGWFPTTVTDPADVDVMHKLLGSLGGEGVATLKPPTTWEMDSSKTAKVVEGRITVPSGTQEYQEVVNYFTVAMHGQRNNVKVTQVERIQNLALWQTFAVKKQTIKARDTKMPQHRVNNDNVVEDLDRQLFHGTTEDVIPKIEKQGFNRAFAGRNAVAYGKGVYFARDAACSSHETYSKPDANGIQRMFLCRVVVGDWCGGTNGQLTPDAKPHSPLELFDSTVDNVRNPSIFVVYHDSQAYPEYLISFTRRV
jgi:ABC-type branched-subunit amino acid transport system substrate-binding protein/type II secretory pathway pseudopilin PulG